MDYSFTQQSPSGGVKTLFEGQKVNFSIEQGSKGLQAVNVIPA
ncbi:cold-shock protein [Vibrio cholerae]